MTAALHGPSALGPRPSAALLLSLFAFGCGTVMHGPRDTLFVDSKPSGADASITCRAGFGANGTTPVKLQLPRKEEGCVLTVERAGYRAERIDLDQGFSGWFWANFAIGPALAAAVRSGQGGGDLSGGEVAALTSTGLFFLIDQLTGSKHNYEPNEIVVELEPLESGSPRAEGPRPRARRSGTEAPR